MSICADCNTNRASKSSPTGRPLCNDCFALLVGYSGAGTAIADGGGFIDAFTTGVAAGSYANVMDGEGESQRQHKEKLDQTEGFFKRLWVRVVG